MKAKPNSGSNRISTSPSGPLGALPEPPFRGRKGLVVGVSGGGDSVALLSLLLTHSRHADFRIQVAHVNYGLRGRKSEKDEDLVRSLCAAWRVPLTVLRVKTAREKVMREKKSLQDWAREYRYEFFSRLARKHGAWGAVVAHQAQDQAETVLDRLLRGAGSRGLTGLRPVQELRFPQSKGPLKIWRPLLSFSREELRLYLKAQDIPWREDESNQKTDYRRNQIRHEVLPFLSRWNPSIVRTLFRIGEVASAQEAFLEESLRKVQAGLGNRWTPTGYRGQKAAFAPMPLALQRIWARRVAEKLHPGARGLPFERLEDVLRVWKGTLSGPRDLGYGLSAEAGKTEIRMRVAAVWRRPGKLKRPNV